MKNRIKRLTALILAMAMSLSLLSTSVWAADAEPQENASITVQSSEEAAPEEATEDTAVEESTPDKTENAHEAGSDEISSVEEESAAEDTTSDAAECTEEPAAKDDASEVRKPAETDDEIIIGIPRDEAERNGELRLQSDEKTLAAMQKKVDLLNLVDPSQFTEPDNEGMTKAQVKTLQNEAKQATQNCTTDYAKIEAICRYVAERLYYDYDQYMGRRPRDLSTIYEHWDAKRGVCQDYSMLSMYLLWSIGIPCMILTGTCHAFNAAYDSQNSRWIIFDSTWCSGNQYSYNGDQAYVEGRYRNRYFDMSAQLLSEIDNHQILDEIEYILCDGVYYILENESENESLLTVEKADWKDPETWELCIYTSKNKDSKNKYSCDASKCTEICGIPVKSVFLGAFEDETNLVDITLPNGLVYIRNYAFSKCSSLKKVVIPDGVTSIKSYAFYDCGSLKEVIIPNSVTCIEEYAFSHCNSLKTITIPSGVTNIGESAFSDCKNLNDVTISDGVVSIGEDAFSYCTSLKSITIPDSVTSIEDFAFSNCTSLKSIIIPETVTSIGKSAFWNWHRLTIYGKTGSYAERYAKKNDIPFADSSNPPEPDPEPAPQTKLTATKLSKVTVKKNVATITWKKNTTGKGYQLQYSTDKKFKKSVKTMKISKNKTTKTTVKKLKKGTWYFRIRTVNGKKTSGWSEVKSVQVK